MVDDSVKKRRGGRPKKITSKDVQRSFWVNPELWDAADGLPISRPDVLRDALANAVSFYKSDLPKLKWQLEELQVQKQSIAAKEALIVSRIKQLEEELIVEESKNLKVEESKEYAVHETMRLTQIFKKKMTHEHFSIISGLSGLDAAQIEVFLVDTKFRPSETEVRSFMRV